MNVTMFIAGSPFYKYIHEQGFGYSSNTTNQQDSEDEQQDPLQDIKSYILYEKIKKLKEACKYVIVDKAYADKANQIKDYIELLDILINFYMALDYEFVKSLLDNLSDNIEKMILKNKGESQRK